MGFDWDIKENRNQERMRIIFSCIPEIQCEDGCTLCCCNNLQLSYQVEYYPLDKLWETHTCNYEYDYHEYGGSCGSLMEGGCVEYNTRPIICRIFFKLKDDLCCFLGLKPTRYLSQEELRRILWCAQYGTLQDAYALRAWMM